MIGDFHFLRPWWLAALLPLLLLLWETRRLSDPGAPWRGIVSPHLLPYLMHSAGSERKGGLYWLLFAIGITTVVALAGPAWQREPSPFADDTAALAVVVEVTSSMEAEDLPPNRLARSLEKLHDLLKRRGGSKTALVVYAGSAHLVMPATVDSNIIDTFAQSLAPRIMPSDGDAAAAALQEADRALAVAGGGSILWITDGVAPEELAAVERWRKTSRTPVRILAPIPIESIAGAKVIPIVPDDSDVVELERGANFSSPAPVAGEHDDRWKDAGYWMTPLVVLLLLPLFRRGWMPAAAARS
ncbi:MAG: VWA domain-containing protein [Luteolibacter sp.]